MKTILSAITLCLIAAPLHAQITNPDNLVAPPPPPPDVRRVDNQSQNLLWMWEYTAPEPRGDKAALFASEPWAALMKNGMHAPQSFWGTGRSLPDAIAAFLGGPGSVKGTKGRYVTVTGCVVDQCGQRGLMWADTRGPNAVAVFCALRWDETARTTDEPHAPYTLYLFSSRVLDVYHLPDALVQAVSLWVYGPDYALSPNITRIVLVDPLGTPRRVDPRQLDIIPTNTK